MTRLLALGLSTTFVSIGFSALAPEAEAGVLCKKSATKVKFRKVCREAEATVDFDALTGEKGDQGDPGPQGIQGIQGIQGDPGSAGVEAGVDWAQGLIGGHTLSVVDLPVDLASTDLTAPADGRHIVIGGGQFRYDPSGGEMYCQLRDGTTEIAFTRAGVASAVGVHVGSIHLQAVTTKAAGSANYNMRCWKLSGNDAIVYWPSVIAIYVPQTY